MCWGKRKQVVGGGSGAELGKKKSDNKNQTIAEKKSKEKIEGQVKVIKSAVSK